MSSNILYQAIQRTGKLNPGIQFTGDTIHDEDIVLTIRDGITQGFASIPPNSVLWDYCVEMLDPESPFTTEESGELLAFVYKALIYENAVAASATGNKFPLRPNIAAAAADYVHSFLA